MFRTHLPLMLAGLIVATAGTSARAQYVYTTSYAPAYGPNLWVWPGSTMEGEAARGMGMAWIGAGVYEYNAAWAAAIHSERIRRENAALELAFLMQCERLARRRAGARARLNNSREGIEERLRYAPTARDVDDGNALNLAVRQLTASRSYSPESPEATVPIATATIRQLPLQYAPGGVTLRLDRREAARGLSPVFRAYINRVGPARFTKCLKDLDREPEMTLAQLLRFMELYHLQFGAAETIKQGAALREVYPHLASLRDSVVPPTRAEKTTTEIP
jgi:hypothetical protein